MAAPSFSDIFKSKAKEKGYGDKAKPEGDMPPGGDMPPAGGAMAGGAPGPSDDDVRKTLGKLEDEISAGEPPEGTAADMGEDTATTELGPDGPKMIEEAKTMPRFEGAPDEEIIKALKSDLRLRMRIQEKVASGADAEMESEPAGAGMPGAGMPGSGAGMPPGGAGMPPA